MTSDQFAIRVERLLTEVVALASTERARLLTKCEVDEPEVVACVRACLEPDEPWVARLLRVRCVAPPTATDAGRRSGLRPGQRFGSYEIEDEIGQGGMGVVYRARHLQLGRTVALKVASTAESLPRERMTRFARESQHQARLRHENVVPVFDAGEVDGILYCAMDFIEGHDLAQVIRQLKRHDGSHLGLPECCDLLMSPAYYRRVAELMLQAANALQHAHENGIVHRDVKPSNLLVDRRGRLLVADFGLAFRPEESRKSTAGLLVGTLKYMSPEQLSGCSADPRSDVFSLGMTCYELLALQHPRELSGEATDLRRLVDWVPSELRRFNPRVPRDLATIVHQAIAPTRDRRYATASDFADDLRSFLERRPILARRANVFENIRLGMYRRPGLAALTVLAVGLMLTLVAVLAGAYFQAVDFGERLARENEVRRSTLADAATTAHGRAIALCESGDVRAGLLTMVEALRYAVEANDMPSERVIRLSLAAWASDQTPLTAIMRHNGRINAVVVSPDERFVATVGDGAAMVWKSDTSALIAGPLTHPRCIAAGFIVAIDRFATVSEDGFVRYWDCHDGALAREVPVDISGIKSAAFSRDGARLLVETDSRFRIWDSVRGEFLEGDVPSREYHQALLGPDGRTVVLHDRREGATLWNVDQACVVGDRIAPVARLYAASRFSSDGRRWVIATLTGRIRVVDLATGDVVAESLAPGAAAEATRPSAAQTSKVAPVDVEIVHVDATADRILFATQRENLVWQTAFGPPQSMRDFRQSRGRTWISPEGRRSASFSRNQVTVRDVDSLAYAGDVLDHFAQVRQIGFFPASGRLFSVSADHTLRVWGDGPVAPLRRTYCARTRFHALAFSPDGKRLAVACDNGVVQVLEWAQDRVPPIELRHDSPVRTLAWSDDGATLWTGVAGAPATGGETSKHAAIVQWRVADGRTLRTIPQPAPIEGLVLGRGGHFLAASSGDSTVRVYALAPDAATLVFVGRPPPTGSRNILNLCAANDAESFLYTRGDTLSIIDVAASPPTEFRQKFRADSSQYVGLFTAGFCGRRSTIFYGGTDQRLSLREPLETATRPQAWQHPDVVNVADFSPAGCVAVTGCADGRVRFWSVDDGSCLMSANHGARVFFAKLLADERHVVTGADDARVRLWDMQTGFPVGAAFQHRSGVAGVAVASDDAAYASAGEDGVVVVSKIPRPISGSLQEVAEAINWLTIGRLDTNGASHELEHSRWVELNNQRSTVTRLVPTLSLPTP